LFFWKKKFLLPWKYHRDRPKWYELCYGACAIHSKRDRQQEWISWGQK